MHRKKNITHPDFSCSAFGEQKAVYFIGIGGIGMSALARYYKHTGALVAGYDRTSSPLTKELEHEGIAIHYEDQLTLIPELFFQAPEKVLVIYTPAVPADHSELCYFQTHHYNVIKRSAALGNVAANKTTLAVAGTHGKTTISSLLAHLLTQAGGGCTAFLGGISKNYDSNLLLSKSPALVAEADEFDRSFLQLFPTIAIIIAADPDHLDIYGTAENFKQTFSDFAHQIKPNGYLIMKLGVELPLHFTSGQKLYRYSFDTPCDFYASHIHTSEEGYPQFDLHYPGGVLNHCTLNVFGGINIENAVAATAAAYLYGADMQAIKKALASFCGVQRRFDVIVNTAYCTYMDDYAHHPEELRAAIHSLKAIFPHRKITGIFQPHLYTRTRDFADDFGTNLSLLDELILLDIYPAREEPIEGISSKIIFDKVTCLEKTMCKKDELIELLNKRNIKDFDILVTFGAGDIDRFVKPIGALLKEKLSE